MNRFRIDGYTAGMSKNLERGDKVQWNSHGSTVTGTVEEKITSDTQAAGLNVRASREGPQYRVRSDKSGRAAVHKPDALRRPK